MNQNIMNVDKNVRHIGRKVRAEIVKLEAKQQKFETMLAYNEVISSLEKIRYYHIRMLHDLFILWE